MSLWHAQDQVLGSLGCSVSGHGLLEGYWRIGAYSKHARGGQLPRCGRIGLGHFSIPACVRVRRVQVRNKAA